MTLISSLIFLCAVSKTLSRLFARRLASPSATSRRMSFLTSSSSTPRSCPFFSKSCSSRSKLQRRARSMLAMLNAPSALSANSPVPWKSMRSSLTVRAVSTLASHIFLARTSTVRQSTWLWTLSHPSLSHPSTRSCPCSKHCFRLSLPPSTAAHRFRTSRSRERRSCAPETWLLPVALATSRVMPLSASLNSLSSASSRLIRSLSLKKQL